MSYIEIAQPDGTSFSTLIKAGSQEETQFFRVITERFGKLWFDSRETYEQWCSTGRIATERRGYFQSGPRHASQIETNNEAQDEFVIIEEYVVEENGDVVDA